MNRSRRPSSAPRSGAAPKSLLAKKASTPPPPARPPKKPRSPASTGRPAQKSNGQPLPWREALLPLLSEAGYQPLDELGLTRKLRVGAIELPLFREFLAHEIEAGHIMQVRHSFYVLPARLGFCTGTLQMNERGFGFLVSTDPAQDDFYIAGEDTGTALHGDLVLARLKENRGRRDSRQRGEVVKVLQRKRRQLVGLLKRASSFYFVTPDEARIPHDILVPHPIQPSALGQKVVVTLRDWVDRRKPLEGLISEVLGSPDAPGVDLISIIRKHDLPTSFPEAVERQAAEISATIPPEELARREDFRKLFTITIDPDDAKDFDDALSAVALPQGGLEIYVHIADVSHYVAPGTPLDEEARQRGNSIYLVDRVLPMLPEKLSNGICSLQPEVDRLVKTAIVRLDGRGEVQSFRFAAGVIHSAKRFSYQEAFALIKKKPVTPLGKYVHQLHEMAQVLRKKRFDRGALELDMPEVKVRLDALGQPTHLERMENDFSHQLIEEFMLLANEVVALELKRRGRPGLYRIHETPDPDRLEEYRAQAKSMGYPCGDLTVRGEIQKLLRRVRDQPGEAVVKIGLLRSLKRAMYSPKPLGHYGLAKINYTHFTSPIRRYADLVVHRVVFGGSKAAPGSGYNQLAELAAHLSITERTAAEAEQESVKLKKLEYFQRQAAASEQATFRALVLEVRASGLSVELPDFMVQGRVALSDLAGDLYTFNAQRLELQGQRHRALIRAGITLPVSVAAVDLGRRQVDFRVAAPALAKLK